MKLAILSRQPDSYSTMRLHLAALDRGHEVDVLDTLRFAIDLAGDGPDMAHRSQPIEDYDAIIPRIGASITYFGTAVVRQFEPSRSCPATRLGCRLPPLPATATTCYRPSNG